MERAVQLQCVVPDLAPEISFAGEDFAERSLAVGGDETQQVASREASIQGRKQQPAQILDQPALGNTVPPLDAMQINEREFDFVT